MFLTIGARISEETYIYYRPFIWFVRLMGFFPLAVERIKSQVFLKLSYNWICYSALLGAVWICLTYHGEISDIIDGTKGVAKLNSVTDSALGMINVTTFNMVCFCGVFLMPSRFLYFFAYAKCLLQVDSIIKTSYRNSTKYKLLSILVVSSGLMASITFISGYVIYTNRKHEVTIPQILNVYSGVGFVSVATVIVENMGAIIMSSLELRIRRLNAVLELKCSSLKIQLETRELQRKSVFEQVGKAKPNKRRVVVRLVSIEKLEDANVKTTADNSVADLRAAYMKIMDAADNLNNCIGPSHLIFILSTFWAIILVLYFLGLTISHNRSLTLHITGRSIWFCVSFLRVLIVTEPSYANLVQMESTKRWVCCLLSYDFGQTYRRQVKTFALILGLRRLEFTPCGLLTVDRRLFISLVESITTMLVVMLQAQASEKH